MINQDSSLFSSTQMEDRIWTHLLHLIEEARGRTDPNPPVAACIAIPSTNFSNTDSHAAPTLYYGEHLRAGAPHAEADVIRKVQLHNINLEKSTLYVTLEPCNHSGRTPPCVDAIIRAGIKNVRIALMDSNPNVKGGGLHALVKAGLSAEKQSFSESLDLSFKRALGPFFKFSKYKKPWITVKTAHRPDSSMIPDPGQKTFSSQRSLQLAHRLRKRSRAILTGSGTVLADSPEFTVRHVPDHEPRPTRHLFILDRRKRVPKSYLERQRGLGFVVSQIESMDEAIHRCSHEGILEMLVEAGPTLSASVLGGNFWDSHIQIQTHSHSEEDTILERFQNNSVL